jgi:hypothetical protein
VRQFPGYFSVFSIALATVHSIRSGNGQPHVRRRGNSLRFLIAFLATTLGAIAAARLVEVNVVVDMTPEGRKRTPPDPDHPSYYVPIVGKFREEGAVFAGGKAPSQNDLLHLAAIELAKQSYFVCPPGKAHTPDIILVFNWGCMNPDRVTQPAPAGNPMDKDPEANGGSDDMAVVVNDRQMLDLVGGATLQNLNSDADREAVADRAQENRYFIVISAFDFPTSVHNQKKVPLWQAKLSVPSAGVSYDDIAEVMIETGSPFFGRETATPKRVTIPVVPEGHVLLGTPQTKDYQDVPPAPAGTK